MTTKPPEMMMSNTTLFASSFRSSLRLLKPYRFCINKGDTCNTLINPRVPSPAAPGHGHPSKAPDSSAQRNWSLPTGRREAASGILWRTPGRWMVLNSHLSNNRLNARSLGLSMSQILLLLNRLTNGLWLT